MAITAWSAKVLSSLIWLSVKGRTSVRTNGNRADRDAFAQQWRGKHGANAEPIHRDFALWELIIGLSR